MKQGKKLRDEDCQKYVSLADIEGYAMNCMVANAEARECDEHRRYLVVGLVDGRILCSECVDSISAEISLRVVEYYTKYARLCSIPR